MISRIVFSVQLDGRFGEEELASISSAFHRLVVVSFTLLGHDDIFQFARLIPIYKLADAVIIYLLLFLDSVGIF